MSGVPLAKNSWMRLYLVSLPKWCCRMGDTYLDGHDWVLYSVGGGAMNKLPCPGRAEGQDTGPVQLDV